VHLENSRYLIGIALSLCVLYSMKHGLCERR